MSSANLYIRIRSPLAGTTAVLCLVFFAGSLTLGCSKVRSDGGEPRNQVSWDGLINGFVGSFNSSDTWNPELVTLKLDPNAPMDEDMAAVGIKHLFEVGIGTFGARLQTYPLSLGMGAVSYFPELKFKAPAEELPGAIERIGFDLGLNDLPAKTKNRIAKEAEQGM